MRIIPINPFSTNVPLLQPLKTSENRKFLDVFKGYRSRALVENVLMSKFINDAKYLQIDSQNIQIKTSNYFKLNFLLDKSISECENIHTNLRICSYFLKRYLQANLQCNHLEPESTFSSTGTIGFSVFHFQHVGSRIWYFTTNKFRYSFTCSLFLNYFYNQ